MALEYLLTRGEDLAVLGVRFEGFAALDVATTTLTALDGATITLVLPPQHVQEQTANSPADVPNLAAAQLSGTSRLAFAVPAQTVVDLVPEAVLALAREALRPGGTEPTSTSIEMPWALALAPVDGSAQHPASAVRSPDGVSGVWLTRLTGPEPGGLTIAPVDRSLAATADAVPDPPITSAQRLLLWDHLADTIFPATATRWQLTPLGGDLTAAGAWDGFTWSQRITGGRDQYVCIEERVRLYPFGFAATLTTLTRRDPAPGERALLLRQISLRLDETVLATGDGRAINRTFPFDRVEVLDARFSDLGEPEPSYVYTRVTPSTHDLEVQRDDLRTAAENEHKIWGPWVDGQHRTLDFQRRLGMQSALDYDAAAAADSASSAEYAGALASDAERQAILDSAQEFYDKATEIRNSPGYFGPDGFPDHDLEASAAQADADGDSIRASAPAGIPFVEMERMRLAAARDAAALEAARGPVDAAAQAFCDISDAIAFGDEQPEVSAAAQRGAEDAAEADRLDVRIRALVDARVTLTITSWPMTADRRRLSFPVRLSRGSQVVDVHMPMMLVHEVVLPAIDDLDLPAYYAFDDPALPVEVDKAWAGPAEAVPSYAAMAAEDHADAGSMPASVVQVGGQLLDLVGAPAPKPSDTQVLRTLNLLGGTTPRGLFRPTLGRLESAGRRRRPPLGHGGRPPRAAPAGRRGRSGQCGSGGRVRPRLRRQRRDCRRAAAGRRSGERPARADRHRPHLGRGPVGGPRGPRRGRRRGLARPRAGPARRARDQPRPEDADRRGRHPARLLAAGPHHPRPRRRPRPAPDRVRPGGRPDPGRHAEVGQRAAQGPAGLQGQAGAGRHAARRAHPPRPHRGDPGRRDGHRLRRQRLRRCTSPSTGRW